MQIDKTTHLHMGTEAHKMNSHLMGASKPLATVTMTSVPNTYYSNGAVVVLKIVNTVQQECFEG